MAREYIESMSTKIDNLKVVKHQCDRACGEPPPSGIMEVNFDDAVQLKRLRGVVAMVIRDEASVLNPNYHMRIPCATVELVEMKAMILAMNFTHNMAIREVIFEFDCLTIVKGCKGDNRN